MATTTPPGLAPTTPEGGERNGAASADTPNPVLEQVFRLLYEKRQRTAAELEQHAAFAAMERDYAGQTVAYYYTDDDPAEGRPCVYEVAADARELYAKLSARTDAPPFGLRIRTITDKCTIPPRPVVVWADHEQIPSPP